jgi:hypothetical protein
MRSLDRSDRRANSVTLTPAVMTPTLAGVVVGAVILVAGALGIRRSI